MHLMISILYNVFKNYNLSYNSYHYENEFMYQRYGTADYDAEWVLKRRER